MKFRAFFTFIFALMLFTGCSKSEKTIITGLHEKEANLIVVFLESKGIAAHKEQMILTGAAATSGGGTKYNIVVNEKQSIDALAILNRNGLPRKMGTTLLELFAKQGLMTSDREETIRYHAGLAQQLTNTILLMDGVIDASVQLSFPQEDNTPGVENKEKITAAVYVKHMGILDDPNSHLETKIKRLISGSITGLDINDVTVVSDRSRLTEATPAEVNAMMASKNPEKGYVSIWSIVMSKESASKFKTIFFFCLLFTILFGLVLGWVLWKIFPLIRAKGLKELLRVRPLEAGGAPAVAAPKQQQAPPEQEQTPPPEAPSGRA